MQNILNHFSRFLDFCEETVQTLRTNASLPPISLSFAEFFKQSPQKFPEANAEKSLKSQLFVMEFAFKEKKSANSSFLMEQWIFTVHADKLPRNASKIVRTEDELAQSLRSFAKTVANLCVNLPLYREFLRPDAKYSKQLGYDFELQGKSTRELAKISNFQGWDSEKWSRFYAKFPESEDFCFFVICEQIAYKFSFRVNFFKNVFHLYKVVEPARKFRERCVSDNGFSQRNCEGSEEKCEAVAWNGGERRSSLEESFDVKGNREKSKEFHSTCKIAEIQPKIKDFKQYSAVYKGIVEKLGGSAKNSLKIARNCLNEAAFLEICAGNAEKHAKIAQKSGDSLIFLIEMLENKRKSNEKPLKTKKIQEFLQELREFHEKIDVSLQ